MKIDIAGVSLLRLLDDYFEGTGYGPGRTDGFALQAPTTLFRFNNGDNVLSQYKSIAGAHANT